MSGTSLRDRSVLVTGGAGFIGSHFVDRLVREDPSRITVVDNFFLGNTDNLRDALAKRSDIEVARLDASDLASMQDVVTSREVDVVFDFAVVPLPTSLRFPAWTVMTNVGIVTTFCDIARRELVERLVHVSSSEAYGSARYVPMDENHPHDAITPYAASKSAGDHVIQSYIETFGIDATIVRPFNNVGPRQNPGSYAGIVPIVVQKVMRGETIEIHGDGEQTRDFVYAPDTADAVLAVYNSEECRRQVLNVATGVETSINDLVRRLLGVLGAENHPVVHVGERPGDVRRHCADVTKMQQLLGKTAPSITDDELAATAEWYRARVA
jgi:UDP-glucose 4-epimerase